MATALVERLGVPVLWLAHRKELIDQAAERLAAHGLRAGVVMAGYQSDPDAGVQVASVQTLVRRDKPPAGLVVVDECHHAAAETYQKILEDYSDAALVGLTATPFRLDGRGLGDLFGELVVAARPDELCASGVLHRPKVWASKAPDLRGVRVTAGDYNLGALAERSNNAELTADIVETWKKRAAGRRTVAFAVDIVHSEAITEAFRLAGVPAEHLDGAISRKDRDAILARLASGETLVVSNCMVLTEGWDLPALECAIIARPTASLNLHLQMIGRVMRACQGKDGAIVLDHAGNHHVHGSVTRRLEYRLGRERVGFSEPLGLRRCQACGLLYDTAEPCCPECGWKPERVDRKTAEVHASGDLVELDETPFETKREVWHQFEAQRVAAGYREGWSYYRFRELFGVSPLIVDGEIVDPIAASEEQRNAVYRRYLTLANERGYKPGWAAYQHKRIFGTWPKKAKWR